MSKLCGCGFDVGLASHVQQLLFPKISPACGWCCIGIKNTMAHSLGGDFFDFATLPDDCQAVFVGDVTGHGLHASVVMSLLYGYIHHSFRDQCSPLDVVHQANDFLQTFAVRSKEFDHYFSSTLFCGIIDPVTLEMEYVNAGHPEPLVRRGDEVLSLAPTGPPIGFFDDPEIAMGRLQFRSGDRLLLYTDGITNSFNKAGEFYELERLKAGLRRNRSNHLEYLEELFADLKEFGAEDPPGDDCTAIVVDFNGVKKS